MQVKICLEDSTMSNPVHTERSDGCAGISNLPIPSTAWRAVHREYANQVQPSRLIWSVGNSLSEGILSYVEYAPRLLMVLPSRQFYAYDFLLMNKANKLE